MNEIKRCVGINYLTDCEFAVLCENGYGCRNKKSCEFQRPLNPGEDKNDQVIEDIPVEYDLLRKENESLKLKIKQLEKEKDGMKNCAGIIYINQCEHAVLMNGKFGCKFEGACEYQRPKQNEKFDSLLKGNTELKKWIESLKCCGNCEIYWTCVCVHCGQDHNYCGCWKSDGLTREEREIKRNRG